MTSKAAFLDRDGTIIEERDFIRKPDQIQFIPGSVDAIKTLRNLGYKIVVISNQSGIGRGILTEQMVREVNQSFMRRLEDHGAPVDAIYFCTHHPDDKCNCRKPKPGMVDTAVEELGLEVKGALVIGDKLADVKLGKNIGAKTALVLTGYGKEEAERLKDVDSSDQPDYVAENLLQAVSRLAGGKS